MSRARSPGRCRAPLAPLSSHTSCKLLILHSSQVTCAAAFLVFPLVLSVSLLVSLSLCISLSSIFFLCCRFSHSPLHHTVRVSPLFSMLCLIYAIHPWQERMARVTGGAVRAVPRLLLVPPFLLFLSSSPFPSAFFLALSNPFRTTVFFTFCFAFTDP